MNPKVEIVTSDKDLKQVIELRYNILRKPWNQPIESASDDKENNSVNSFIRNREGIVVACGRLEPVETNSGQIRFMAVAENVQGKGFGKLILSFLENQAKVKKYSKILLQARENALSFYLKNGYSQKDKSFLLWGIIQHYLMEKEVRY